MQMDSNEDSWLLFFIFRTESSYKIYKKFHNIESHGRAYVTCLPLDRYDLQHKYVCLLIYQSYIVAQLTTLTRQPNFTKHFKIMETLN